jgi:hypothetical protein
MATRYLHQWPSGEARYYVDDKTVYELDGKPAFYIQDITLDGKPRFRMDGEHLYEHGASGQPALYFGPGGGGDMESDGF